MRQYSAKDGVPNDWHRVHLGALALGGAGLVVAEAIAVAHEGRITPSCTGLWNDSQVEAFRTITRFIESHGAVPGIQIAYAGRKASANRARFILETLGAVREVWPERLALTARLGVIDYVEREQLLDESIELVRRMKAGGLDLIDVSMGFNTPDISQVPWREHGFLVPIAHRIRREAGIPVATSWNTSDPRKADGFIRDEQVDVVMLAKAMLDDPHWPYHAARALGRATPETLLPKQYG